MSVRSNEENLLVIDSLICWFYNSRCTVFFICCTTRSVCYGVLQNNSTGNPPHTNEVLRRSVQETTEPTPTLNNDNPWLNSKTQHSKDLRTECLLFRYFRYKSSDTYVNCSTRYLVLPKEDNTDLINKIFGI